MILAWPGAPGLQDEQWLLLWTLCRTLHWFAQRGNPAPYPPPSSRCPRAAAWPGFQKAYLLLGEVGTHFTSAKWIKEDNVLLRPRDQMEMIIESRNKLKASQRRGLRTFSFNLAVCINPVVWVGSTSRSRDGERVFHTPTRLPTPSPAPDVRSTR